MSDDSWRDRYTHPSSTQGNLSIKARTKQLSHSTVWIIQGDEGGSMYSELETETLRQGGTDSEKDNNISFILSVKDVSNQIFKQ